MDRLPETRDREAVEVMTRAFAEDPFFNFLERDAARRASVIEAVMSSSLVMARRQDAAHGIVDGAVRGVCLWYEAGRYPTPALATLAARARAMAGVALRGHFGPRVAARALRAGTLLDEAHPKDEPYFYLQVLAVRHDLQGQGLGSRMLTACAAQADAAGRPAVLETSKPANRRLYERFGFRVVETNVIDSSPAIWTMRRDPRPVS